MITPLKTFIEINEKYKNINSREVVKEITNNLYANPREYFYNFMQNNLELMQDLQKILETETGYKVSVEKWKTSDGLYHFKFHLNDTRNEPQPTKTWKDDLETIRKLKADKTEDALIELDLMYVYKAFLHAELFGERAFIIDIRNSFYRNDREHVHIVLKRVHEVCGNIFTIVSHMEKITFQIKEIQ